MKFALFIVLVGLLLANPVFAAQQTIILDVKGMTCAACPITVKTALAKVAGVHRAEVHFEKRQIVVTFDDVQTTIGLLTRATADAGFPSSARPAQ